MTRRRWGWVAWSGTCFGIGVLAWMSVPDTPIEQWTFLGMVVWNVLCLIASAYLFEILPGQRNF